MAKVVRTPKGFRVVHSLTRQPLTGVFRGRGAKLRAHRRADRIRRRNMRRR